MLSEDVGGAVQGVGGAHRLDKGGYATAGLAPDLLTERMVAGLPVSIVELVGPVAARFGRQASRGLDHLLDQLLSDLSAVARNQHDLSPERRHAGALLLAEGVAADEDAAIRAGRADEGERHPSAAARVLDHAASGLETPIRASTLDHGKCQAVLHAPRGIGGFQLDQHASAAARTHPTQLDNWRVAHRVEHPRHERHCAPSTESRQDRGARPGTHSAAGRRHLAGSPDRPRPRLLLSCSVAPRARRRDATAVTWGRLRSAYRCATMGCSTTLCRWRTSPHWVAWTTITGTRLRCRTLRLTLPSSSERRLPLPREPITTRS